MKLAFETLLLGTALAAAACNQGPKAADNATGTAPPAAKPSDNAMRPEPVDRAPRQPSPDPAPAASAIRPPTAADLADYVKDLPAGNKLTATIETSLGTIHCELFGDKAPMTVANFVGLATGKKPWLHPRSKQLMTNTPYFDGLTFHRVIPGFMIQGGDPLGVGVGGPGYMFANEIAPGLDMGPGTLAMANAGAGTNGSQFFVMEGARPDLVGSYNIFGKCGDADVVTKITHTKTNSNDKPETPVVMTKVTIGRS